jgi:ribosomal protein S18 acetylase RimI-like enzyme
MPSDILGFFTLTVCEIHTEELPTQFAKKYPRIAPAAKLARLAVSKDWQRQGLGKLMMTEAMQRITSVSQNVGIIGFLVDAKDETAKRYYQRYGFIEFPMQPLTLFLPIDTLRRAFEA